MIWTIKKISIVTACTASFFGACAAAPTAWSALGLPMFTTRESVKAYVQYAINDLKVAAEADHHAIIDTQKTLRDTQIDVYQSRRQATDRDVFDLKERLKVKSDPDVQWRLHQQENELQAIDKKIDALQKAK